MAKHLGINLKNKKTPWLQGLVKKCIVFLHAKYLANVANYSLNILYN